MPPLSFGRKSGGIAAKKLAAEPERQSLSAHRRAKPEESADTELTDFAFKDHKPTATFAVSLRDRANENSLLCSIDISLSCHSDRALNST
jgi:hypothetical protein